MMQVGQVNVGTSERSNGHNGATSDLFAQVTTLEPSEPLQGVPGTVILDVSRRNRTSHGNTIPWQHSSILIQQAPCWLNVSWIRRVVHRGFAYS